jgi:hypothetical protein
LLISQAGDVPSAHLLGWLASQHTPVSVWRKLGLAVEDGSGKDRWIIHDKMQELNIGLGIFLAM